MSEQVPERSAPPARAGGGGNVFTNRIGPLPMWAWLAVVAGILVVWRLYSNSKQSQSQQQQPSTDASQVPQFVNQTYTTVTAPSAPVPGQGPPPPGSGGPPGDVHGPPTIQPGGRIVPRPRTRLSSVTGLRSTGAGATNINLAWNPASDATQYQVRVTYQDSIVKTAMTKGTSYNVTGLSPNRTYGLHVVAINDGQWAPETSIVQKTT